MKELLSSPETALSSLSGQQLVISDLLNRINDHAGDRHTLVKELFVQLRVHSILEQQFLFPDISSIVGKETLRSAGKDFYEMLALMLELEQVNIESPVFDRALIVLGERFNKHAKEQQRLFSELAKKTDANQLEALDKVMLANKSALCEKVRTGMLGFSAAHRPVSHGHHVRCS